MPAAQPSLNVVTNKVTASYFLVAMSDGDTQRTVLVDAGYTTGGPDRALNTLKNLLDTCSRQENGKYVLDYVFITHTRKEHWNLLPELFRIANVGALRYAGRLSDYPTAIRDLISIKNGRGYDGFYSNVAQPEFQHGFTKLYILGVDSSGGSGSGNPNGKSLVLAVRHLDTNILLLSHADKLSLKMLEESVYDIVRDGVTLVMGHPEPESLLRWPWSDLSGSDLEVRMLDASDGRACGLFSAVIQAREKASDPRSRIRVLNLPESDYPVEFE
ncbi:hypothetical protein [Streptomyces sp. FIT100]|uniref:hypothetical protein n=1 Tax=Streptomyces sp. FIT100 TaxID=2837956 RepID=UPI0021C6CD40|nr:hypothetical protein [Streptomyces sp. FIT100]UUN30887.1 hypothetical protein KK483_34540 [Streptomyces sp. FIT100]